MATTWARAFVAITGAAAAITALNGCAAPGSTVSHPAPANSMPASSAAPTRSATPVKPWDMNSTNTCSLLTQQDATVALGFDPGPGKTREQTGQGQCDYGGPDTDSVLIQAVIQNKGRPFFDSLNAKDLASGSAIAIPDVGDSAVSTTIGKLVILKFIKGVMFVDIWLELGNADTDSARLSAAVTLAKTVAARI